MSSADAARAKSRMPLTEEQLEHMLEYHVTAHLEKDRNMMEIGWAVSCGHKTCPIPHKAVAFYYCPCRPCPPTS